MRSCVVLAVLLACKGKEPAPAAAPVVDQRKDHQAGWYADSDPAVRHVAAADGTLPRGAWRQSSFAMPREIPTAIGNSGPVGTAHRVLDAIADPKAAWAIVCQQRRDTNGDGTISWQREEHFTLGDKPAAYLVVGGGPGIELEAIDAISPTGDHIVVMIDSATVLLDLRTLTGEVLEAADTASFTGDGSALVYVEKRGDRNIAHRQILATGVTTSIDLPAGGLGGIVATDAQWSAIELARTASTPGQPPQVRDEPWHEPYLGWCSLESPFHDATGDPSVQLWLDFDRGQIIEDKALVRPFGAHRLTRIASGLALDGTPLAPRGCKALDMIGVFPPSGAVVLQCYDTAKISITAPPAKPFTIDGTVDRTFSPIPRTLPATWCVPERQCVDLATGTRVPMVRRPPPPAHDVEVRADTQELVKGAGDMGPLRWRPRPAE